MRARYPNDEEDPLAAVRRSWQKQILPSHGGLLMVAVMDDFI